MAVGLVSAVYLGMSVSRYGDGIGDENFGAPKGRAPVRE
jgi:hypothetical protein